jgi:phospholipid/cholesterol/gamma-HCH transport system permease protein
LIVHHVRTIGVESLSVVILSGVFTGMVMGLQGYYSLRKFNAENFLGSAVALGILRELGPVLSAFMVTGRTGSAMAAELASMKVSEQIDALYSMAVNPIQYLVTPRIIAGLISMPLLTAIFDVVAIYGAYVVGVQLLGVSSGSYFSGMELSVVFKDVLSGFLKSVSFGLIITWICCYKGFNAPPMATGVGQATTESVVLCFVMILVWNYFMTSVML